MNRQDFEAAKARCESKLSRLENISSKSREEIEERLGDIEWEIDELQSERRRLERVLDDLPEDDGLDEDEIKAERQRLANEKRRIEQYINDHFDSNERGDKNG